MSQDDFEAAVLRLWTRTRVPLTRANLQAYSKVPRVKMELWLDRMVKAGVLELDSDDDGELLWQVRGAARSTRGPTTLGEVDTYERLSKEADRIHSVARTALKVAGSTASAPGKEKKSLIASGILSFFFGPLGWLYAAPLWEAVPAIAVYLLIVNLLPGFILFYLIGILHAVSALAGLIYAFAYNRTGERTRLFGAARAALPPRRKR
jgi:hypothetical protein